MTATVPLEQVMAQARQIEALTAERDGLKYTLEAWAAEYGEGGPRALKADVKALAEALTMILPYAEHSFSCPEATSAFTQDILDTVSLARAALARDGVRRGGGRRDK